MSTDIQFGFGEDPVDLDRFLRNQPGLEVNVRPGVSGSYKVYTLGNLQYGGGLSFWDWGRDREIIEDKRPKWKKVVYAAALKLSRQESFFIERWFQLAFALRDIYKPIIFNMENTPIKRKAYYPMFRDWVRSNEEAERDLRFVEGLRALIKKL